MRSVLLLLGALAVPLLAGAAPLELGAADRVLVLAPHPDDETLACAGMVQQARAVGAAVRVAFLTNGDANEVSFAVYRRHPVVAPAAVRRMGKRRHDEALAAARVLGLTPDQLTFLGYPDFGTLDIWTRHWGGQPPLRSLLTDVTAVPYAQAYRPGAPYRGDDILSDLTAVIRDFRPTVILVSHPADRNPDHRALYLFTRVAVWQLGAPVAPRVLPYLVHYPHWPAPRGLDEDASLEPPAGLAASVAWQQLPLTVEMRAAKLAALRAHDTQMRYSADFLLSFVRADELFGDLPAPTLRPDTRTDGLVAGDDGREPPEELTAEERTAFVGMEGRSFRLDGHDLLATTRFSRPLGEAVQLTVYLFGQRDDRPFVAMPKLRVEVGVFETRAIDQDHVLPAGTASLTRAAREITVRVPLAALGSPQRVLTTVHTSLAEVPLGALPWQVLDLDRADHGPDPMRPRLMPPN